MPCLDISLPKIDLKTKESLIAKLTDDCFRIADFEPEIFRVGFFEYEVGCAGTNGKLWDGNKGIPYVHFVLYCPRLKRTVKRNLIVELGRSFTEIIGQPDWLPVIHIEEHPYDNIGAHGDMLSDRPVLCHRKFYYDLPKD